MQKQAIQQESLQRATSSQSFMNYFLIIEGFKLRGIPEGQVLPRVNVFTYNAWQALGRQVRKGEKGVQCVTFVQASKTDKQTGEKTGFRRPWHTSVFHVSQTDPVGGPARQTVEENGATGENAPYAGEMLEVDEVSEYKTIAQPIAVAQTVEVLF